MQSHMGKVGSVGNAMKQCTATQTDMGDVHCRGDRCGRCMAMWSGTGKAGSECERKGVVGYCKGKGPRQLVDGWWGGEGTDSAGGGRGCQVECKGGD
jgi:hypothetical protein